MFYAIEYAYGRNVANNGQRPDRVLEFTAKRLRDAWVADGNVYTTNPGYRENLSARDSRVRGAYGLENGDRDAWQAIALLRVRQSAALRRHQATIDYDWPDADHYRWVATASEGEIVSWAEAVEADVYE